MPGGGAAAVLEQHASDFVRRWLALVPDTQAIVLYGSYGRDEGAWYSEGGELPRPYNDYDLCVIGPRRLPPAELAQFRVETARAFGVRWVDVTELTASELSRLRLSIRNYDLKHASRVLYGDARVLDRIPVMDAARLPLKEAEILFFTRLYTLVGSLGPEGLSATLTGESSRFFLNQLAKAVLAAVDVLLLDRGRYHPSYRERVARIHTLFPSNDELRALSGWALEEKLRPQAPDMHPLDATALYGRVRGTYLAAMYPVLGRYYGRPVRGAADVERAIKTRPVQLLKRLFWVLRYRDLRMERPVNALLAQAHLVDAWRSPEPDAGMVSHAVGLLRTIDPGLPPSLTWDEARLQSVRLRG